MSFKKNVIYDVELANSHIQRRFRCNGISLVNVIFLHRYKINENTHWF